MSNTDHTQVGKYTWHYALSFSDHAHPIYCRCLLNKNAAPIMKIIQDIFGLILKFRSQLLSRPWSHDSDLGQVTHPAFDLMCNTYKSFNEYSRFLFKGKTSSGRTQLTINVSVLVE